MPRFKTVGSGEWLTTCDSVREVAAGHGTHGPLTRRRSVQWIREAVRPARGPW